MKKTIIMTNPELARQHFDELVNITLSYIERGVTIQEIVFNLEMIKTDLVDAGRFQEDG